MWFLACSSDESSSYFLFAKETVSMAVYWPDLAQVTAPPGPSSGQGKKKNLFFLHSGILAGCETWNKCLGRSPTPVDAWHRYFPILRNAASVHWRFEHVLNGFISWWWWTCRVSASVQGQEQLSLTHIDTMHSRFPYSSTCAVIYIFHICTHDHAYSDRLQT